MVRAFDEQTVDFEARDTLTLEAVFHLHAEMVSRLVARLLGPSAFAADIDDVVQQSFLAIDRALPTFRGDSALKTWVYAITTRVTMHHLRTRRRYRAAIDRFQLTTLIEPPVATAHETFEKREAHRRIWSALEKIKVERRAVLILFELEEMSAPQVAAMLEITEDAVRSRLRLGRRDLERELAKQKGTSR